jgi:hypothetical protein
MTDRNLVGAMRKSLDDLHNNTNMSMERKRQVMNKVSAMLNNGDYQSMTLPELKQIARQKGVKRYTEMRHDQLVDALNGETIPMSQLRQSAQRKGQYGSRSRERVGQAYKSRELYGSRERVGCGPCSK